jgi:hypothetical protein
MIVDCWALVGNVNTVVMAEAIESELIVSILRNRPTRPSYRRANVNSSSNVATRAVQQRTRSIPIDFKISEPIEDGLGVATRSPGRLVQAASVAPLCQAPWRSRG